MSFMLISPLYDDKATPPLFTYENEELTLITDEGGVLNAFTHPSKLRGGNPRNRFTLAETCRLLYGACVLEHTVHACAKYDDTRYGVAGSEQLGVSVQISLQKVVVPQCPPSRQQIFN